MQRCSSLLIPLSCRQLRLRQGVQLFQLQPTRNFFSRRCSRIVPTFWNSRVTTFDEHLRDVRNYFDELEHEFNNSIGRIGLLNRRGFFPNFFQPITIYHHRSSPMTMYYESEVDGKYQLKITLGEGFISENIKISLKDSILMVEAKYNLNSEDGKSKIYQEFSREFTLPENINLAEIKSVLTPEGNLQVQAPLLPPTANEMKGKEIPITVESSTTEK